MSEISATDRRSAIRFILCMGLVSLFADMTYEGAHGTIGPLMSDLGASVTAVAIIAGSPIPLAPNGPDGSPVSTRIGTISGTNGIITDNIGATRVTQGAGAVSSQATNNLGGSVEFSSLDPLDHFALDADAPLILTRRTVGVGVNRGETVVANNLAWQRSLRRREVGPNRLRENRGAAQLHEGVGTGRRTGQVARGVLSRVSREAEG